VTKNFLRSAFLKKFSIRKSVKSFRRFALDKNFIFFTIVIIYQNNFGLINIGFFLLSMNFRFVPS